MGVLLVALFARTAGAQGIGAPPPTWRAIPESDWAEPARPDSGGGDAILLLDQTHHEHDGTWFRREYLGRARIFTREGRRYGTIEILVPTPRWKLEGLRARCVFPNGRAFEWDPAERVETEAFHYGGEVLKRVTVVVPGVQPGCIVEWAYTLTGRCEEYEGASFELAHPIYTLHSAHQWISSRTVPSEMPRSWAATGTQRVLVQESCAPDCKAPMDLSFTMGHLAGIQDEDLSPPALASGATVEVYYGRETGPEYWSLWKHTFDLFQTEFGKHADEVGELVRRLESEHPGKDSALVACYRWVQANVRSFTDRSWRERLADAPPPKLRWEGGLNGVLHAQESTPFEINCLMVAMAEQLGLQASIAFVGDRRLGGFDRDRRGFPPLEFLTVVVMKDGTVHYLEPQSRFAEFGSLPWYHRGGSCLMSGKSRDLFRRVPPDAGEKARARWRVSLQLAPGGALSGEVEGRLGGEEAATFRRQLWTRDPGDWNDWFAEQLAAQSGLRLQTQVRDLEADVSQDLVVTGSGRWPDLAATGRERLAIPMAALVPWRMHDVLPAQPRRQIVFLRDARFESIRVDLALPPGYQVEHLPLPREFANAAGKWQSVWSLHDGRVSWVRSVDLVKAEIPRSEYGDIRELLAGLHDSDEGCLIVSRIP